MSFSNGYAHRLALTVTGHTLTNFVFRCVTYLDPDHVTSDSFRVEGVDGDVLAHDLIGYDDWTGRIEIWVKSSLEASGTTVYLYYS